MEVHRRLHFSLSTVACSGNTRHCCTPPRFPLAFTCFWYTEHLLHRLFCKARVRLVSYSAASSAAGPFRNGPVGLVVGFLADIISLSLFAAMCANEFRSRCGYQQYGGDGGNCCRCRHFEAGKTCSSTRPCFPPEPSRTPTHHTACRGCILNIDVEVMWRHNAKRLTAQSVASKAEELHCC